MAEDFQDPLENYDPKEYADPLEEALATRLVTEIQATPYASVAPDTPIAEAVRQIAQLHVACLLVEQDGKLVGVFSDRDVLNRVAIEYDHLQDHPVSEVMTVNPVYVYDSDTSGTVLTVMAVCGFRHVPVIGLDGSIHGVVSPHRVTGFLKRYFDE